MPFYIGSGSNEDSAAEQVENISILNIIAEFLKKLCLPKFLRMSKHEQLFFWKNEQNFKSIYHHKHA